MSNEAGIQDLLSMRIVDHCGLQFPLVFRQPTASANAKQPLQRKPRLQHKYPAWHKHPARRHPARSQFRPSKNLQWTSAPPMTIDTTKQYFATVKMAKGGEFVIQLYPDKAPITVNSFVFLARQGFFNGVTFHRVLEGFMAQGGDPTGTGRADPAINSSTKQNDLTFDKAGVVAMANAGPNTNGSQFFITFGPVQLNESDYTIFGQVISGMDVVNGITRRDPQTNPTFPGDAMASVTISTK